MNELAYIHERQSIMGIYKTIIEDITNLEVDMIVYQKELERFKIVFKYPCCPSLYIDVVPESITETTKKVISQTEKWFRNQNR